MDKPKIINVRFSDRIIQKINQGESVKLGTQVQNILVEHFETKYFADIMWMRMFKESVLFLFSRLDEAGILKMCDIISQNIAKIRMVHFPEKSLWDVWLFVNEKFKIGRAHV